MSYVNLSLNKTIISLTNILETLLNNKVETLRIARLGTCLLKNGLNRNNCLIKKVLTDTLESLDTDGGGIDIEETIWSLAFIQRLEFENEEYSNNGLQWLQSHRNQDGGWGKTERDIARIPITGLLMFMLPEFADEKAVEWLKREWAKDFSRSTRLTYKGGFFLMGLSAAKIIVDECPLIQDTILYLAEEQNEDGGFGPWKDHPIGSDPWSTGIVLLGLLSYPELVKRDVIEKAVNWLAETQLPNGLWPYHYIEEGSAYAYWGLIEALKYLSKDSS